MERNLVSFFYQVSHSEAVIRSFDKCKDNFYNIGIFLDTTGSDFADIAPDYYSVYMKVFIALCRCKMLY